MMNDNVNDEGKEQMDDNEALETPLLNVESSEEQQRRRFVKMTFFEFSQISIQPDYVEKRIQTYSYKMMFKMCLIFVPLTLLLMLCPLYFFSRIGNKNYIVMEIWPYILGIFLYFLFIFGLFVLNYWLYDKFGPVQYSKCKIQFYQRIFGSQTFIIIPILARLGIYYQITLQHGEAIRCFEELDTNPSISDFPSIMIASWRQHAQSLFALKRYNQAAEMIQKILDKKHTVLGAGHNEKTRTSVWQIDYHFLAKCYEKNGNLQLALEAYQKLFQIFENQGQSNVYDAAKSLAKIGKIYELQGNQQDAMLTYNQALEIYISVIGDFPWQPSVAELYTNIATLKQQMGDLNGAIEDMQFAVNVYLRGGKSNEDRTVKSLLDRISSLSYLLPSSTKNPNDNIILSTIGTERQTIAKPIVAPSIV